MLICNLFAGRARQQRASLIAQLAHQLSAQGHNVDVQFTTARGSATSLASIAVAGGADAVFACGGDGTVHEVLQALVSESGESRCALGLIPLGSANALARHMRLPLDPFRAAMEQLRGEPRTIPVGKAEFAGGVRYFTVMAGAGPDGALAKSVEGRQKARFGRLSYYLHAALLFLTRRFPPFDLEWTDEVGKVVRRRATAAMVARVDDLGGMFSGLTSAEASIYEKQLRLLVISPPALLSMPRWFLFGWLRILGLDPLLRQETVVSFACLPAAGMAPDIQLDGEWVGTAPMRVSLLPHALRILVPSAKP